MYLDCFHYGALLGRNFPVNSFGPASEPELRALADWLGDRFHRMDLVHETKGMGPLDKDCWPNEFWDSLRPSDQPPTSP